MTADLSKDEATERLLRMLVALEETVACLGRSDADTASTLRRLRVLQGEIVAALRLLEGDFPSHG